MARSIRDLLAEVGRQIQVLRVEADLSQAELADIVSTSVSSISRLEAGRTVSLSTFIAVVRALDREDWLTQLDPVGTGPSPMELLRQQRGRTPRPQRVRRRR